MLVCSSVQHVSSVKHLIKIFDFLKHEYFFFVRLLLYTDIFISKIFIFIRNIHENNLISKADLIFTINVHHSGKLHTTSMIKAVLDSEHVAIPSEVVPFIYINPISLVGNNLFQGTMVHVNFMHERVYKPCNINLNTLLKYYQLTETKNNFTF